MEFFEFIPKEVLRDEDCSRILYCRMVDNLTGFEDPPGFMNFDLDCIENHCKCAVILRGWKSGWSRVKR